MSLKAVCIFLLKVIHTLFKILRLIRIQRASCWFYQWSSKTGNFWGWPQQDNRVGWNKETREYIYRFNLRNPGHLISEKVCNEKGWLTRNISVIECVATRFRGVRLVGAIWLFLLPTGRRLISTRGNEEASRLKQKGKQNEKKNRVDLAGTRAEQNLRGATFRNSRSTSTMTTHF